MPRFNKTGPEGEGAMTGRKFGRCNSKNFNSNSTSIMNNDDNEVFGRRRKGFCNKNQGNRREGRGLGRGKF